MTPQTKAVDPDRVRRIGQTEVLVSTVGLGASVIGGLFAPVSDADADEVIDAALTAGISYVDTAPLYGLGSSEQRVGRALRRRPRDSFVLSTKVGRLLRADVSNAHPLPDGMWPDSSLRPVFDFSAAGVQTSLEESLERLDLDRVDIVYVHDPDESHLDLAIREALPKLKRLKEDGVIRAYGAGIGDVDSLVRIVRESTCDCILLAGRYTLLDQRALRELLPLCIERGVSVVIGGALNSGVLAGSEGVARFDYAPAPAAIVDRAQALERICHRHGVPLLAAALQFPLAHPAVASLLTGVRSPEELATNLEALATPIPHQLWTELEDGRYFDPGAPVPSAGS